ncbi:alpha/beta hydrolase [Stackebrandtia nassauensis]|uniref:DUF1023 domain-containing protein n=1 Tax=Stackebrandtia nassauensis (strain DSM 44728 / CIP 108903 / NRRL B-16338 / NBRC 102104 / LLR-40K-21) TaxID=446470 RepID=D3Q8H5_STANL|nr:alpha/beta hydrolase [Stackebrandtia nassauensis]ADD42549.1 protein of unknown function DUF1023 [Stackebrandtia nassauensis DSM 44728]
MVDYAQLTNMDTSKLTRAAEESGSLAGALSTSAQDVQTASDIPAGMWAGRDSTAASDLMATQPPPLFVASDAFKRSQAVLEDLVTDLEAARRRLQDAHDLVAGTGLTIGPDGTVTTPVVNNPAEAQANERLAQQVRDVIDEAVRMANDADDKAKDQITATALLADENAIPDNRGDTPKDVKEWWDSLSDPEKQAFIDQHPEKIGNLDGIPPEDRHKANWKSLNDAIDAKRQEIEDIRNTPGYGGPGAADDRNKVEDLQKQLDAMQNLRGIVDDPKHPDRLLMGFDPEGDGKAIIATGNPDKADNVLTHVPGMGSELSTAGNELNRVDRMVSDANQLDPTKETVGVMWLDYDAPDGISNAGTTGYAEKGAPDLAQFQDGLRATHEGAPSHNTVVGHSYGSTVVGHSLKDHGMNTDDVVFAGSPGVGVDHVSGLNTNADVHATRAQHDIIGLVPDGNTRFHVPFTDITLSSHGLNPADPAFGAHSFESSPGDKGWFPGGRSIAAHSQYWDDGNPARDEIARIVTEND